MHHEVELVTIGDELLLGYTVDTNGAEIARALAYHGISVTRRSTVGDDVAAIVTVLSEALDRTGAVITTGGLGPTTDDVTREAVAAAFGAPLELDEPHLAWMRDRWRARFDRDMPAANRRQAMLPRGARKLENRHGSAPGAFLRDGSDRWLMMLPGVPRELRGMLHDTVIPLLGELGCGVGACIRSLTLRTTGVPESRLQDQLDGLELESSLALAYLPGIDGVDLRLTARAADADTAGRMLSAAAASIRERVGEAIYGEQEIDMAAVLLDACRAHDVSLAVAESCTGGLLGARLTAVPGSSDVFLGGVIAYANGVKVRDLAVPPELLDRHGAVSEEVVRAMAKGARERFGTRLALAITGVAGPSGGTPDKPVGLVWICVVLDERVEPRRIHSWGDRAEIRHRAAQAAMDLARRMLEGSLRPPVPGTSSSHPPRTG
jgi:nicotinamide-nucleotide amidase